MCVCVCVSYHTVSKTIQGETVLGNLAEWRVLNLVVANGKTRVREWLRSDPRATTEHPNPQGIKPMELIGLSLGGDGDPAAKLHKSRKYLLDRAAMNDPIETATQARPWANPELDPTGQSGEDGVPVTASMG